MSVRHFSFVESTTYKAMQSGWHVPAFRKNQQHASLNRWSISTNLHAVTSSKAAIFFVHGPKNLWSHTIYKGIWHGSLLLITFAAVGLTQDRKGINRKCVRYSRHVTGLLRMALSWLPSTPQGTPSPALWTCCIYYTSDNSKTSSFLFCYVKEYLEGRILTSQGTALKIRCG
jgi:hypothetical protein